MKTRVRQLRNGKWVGEFKKFWFLWCAVTPAGNVFRPGDEYYKNCQFATQELATDIINKYISDVYGI